MMIINEEELQKLAAIATPVVLWLRKNAHPDCTISITDMSVELSESIGQVIQLDPSK